MLTKIFPNKAEVQTPAPFTLPDEVTLIAEPEAAPMPANRAYIFAKNCTNSHGSFVKGDKARGAFSAKLVKSYLEVGILVPASEK